MPELVDKPRNEKFAFPGLQDRSRPAPPPMPIAIPETNEMAADIKVVRKKKEPTSTPAPASGRKPLKLGKVKG